MILKMRSSTVKIIAPSIFILLTFIGCSNLESSGNANKLFEFNVFLPKNNAGKGAITIGNNLKMDDLAVQADKRCAEVKMKLNPASIVKKECGRYSCFYEYECMVNSAPPPQVIPQRNQVTTDEAKTKCKELGFKGGTENFGNCVLRLTK
jgi:hypothetical protein